MSESTGQLRMLLTGPALCGLLLAGMMLDSRRHHDEAYYEPFHARAAKAIEAIPMVFGDWEGVEKPLAPAETAMLKPNAYRCIAFTNTADLAAGVQPRQAWLVVVQCKRSGYMDGHYPPNCYESRGDKMIDGRGNRREWVVGGRRIIGMEYFFERVMKGRVGRNAVYNFMVLPEQGVRPDITSVNASAEDYQQRYYGAAQFQLVFGGPLAQGTDEARRERDQAFLELIGPCSDVISTLSDGVKSHE